MGTSLQNDSPPWSKTKSPKCRFCLTELASLAHISHAGVGGYNPRLVLTATEQLRWEAGGVPDPQGTSAAARDIESAAFAAGCAD